MHSKIISIATLLAVLATATPTTAAKAPRWVRLATDNFGNVVFADANNIQITKRSGAKRVAVYAKTVYERPWRKRIKSIITWNQVNCLTNSIQVSDVRAFSVKGEEFFLIRNKLVPSDLSTETFSSQIYRYACSKV